MKWRKRSVAALREHCDEASLQASLPPEWIFRGSLMLLPPKTKLIIATHNQGKLRELQEILLPLQLDVVSAGELGLPEPEETGDSFAANALLKAKAAATASGYVALADDSGLSVDILNGDPGIYSARWAKIDGKTDFAWAAEKIRTAIIDKGENPQGAKARFICALTLYAPQDKILQVEGHVEGTLTFPARGEKGFGYDPIFIADQHKNSGKTFAEITPQEKNALSHRTQAFAKLLQKLNG